MRTRTRLILFISLAVNICIVATILSASEPNQPQQIVFPKNTKLPAKYKCPTHGITDKILTLDIQDVQTKYCNVCVMRFVATLLDLNLPKLEIIDPNEDK